ncbi:hypothetical protein GCM10022402_22360 [Salinactinospora qingdaonensis]|uniref:Uncharacterized protein n=1 Tax=Salinactinospora qingdaonensis TaxID=702744 RepID=A0ABP7FKJ4_9ACTN
MGCAVDVAHLSQVRRPGRVAAGCGRREPPAAEGPRSLQPVLHGGSTQHSYAAHSLWGQG